ncbi:MFS transporter [Microbacterium sp. DT81.1]|uniref:MFS transporter n=1 Tax=Microbacterium sp. DT81.1 TaxID=3393413 RepID=UPI003CF6F382
MSRPFGRGSVTALLAHSALIQTIVFLVRPSMTYQAIALDVPIFALGALAATFALVPLALAVPAGGWVDRFGERLLMLVGSATVILATVVLLLAGTTLAGLIAGTALLGAGHLGCIVGQQTVVANTSHGSRLDTMFGYYTFSASLGQAIGPLLIPLAGGAVVNPNTTILFAVGAALSLVLLITTFGIARVPRQPAPASAAPKDSALAILKVPGVARAITTSAVIVAAVDLTLVYIPALGAERGLTAATVGIVLAIRAVFSMISRLFLGRVSARIGRGRLISVSIALSAITLVALAIPLPPWALFIVVALLGLGLGVGQPLTMSWLIEQTPRGRRGRALSLRLAGNRLGQVAIPAAVGAVAVGLGAGAVLVTIGVLLGTTLLLLRGVKLDGDDQ